MEPFNTVNAYIEAENILEDVHLVVVTFETEVELPTALLEPVFSRVAAAEKNLVFAYPKGSDKPAPARAAAHGRRKF